MGKPAVRLTDLTAHGGLVTGPGCPTVLIGKLPAARVGDMQTCPMTTGPVPHVGGPLVGPGCPTVLIGGMPAAVVGDMATCVGPPATILPPGCTTVLIGNAGGGAVGPGSGRGTGGTAGRTSGGRTPEMVPGTESLPVEIQQQLANAAAYLSPDETALLIAQVSAAIREGSGDDSEAEETTELTIADIVEILKGVEGDEGYEAARHFASCLDYTTLTAMAMSGTDGNDPNQMPTRFMLLYGADDNALQEVDTHPDQFDDGEEHRVTVANLRAALRTLGHDVAEDGPYDDEVLRAHAAYLCRARGRADNEGETHVVEKGETLGGIAARHGLASWKYLFECNQDTIGDNPDLLAAGLDLTIPQWDSSSGEQRIRDKGASPFRYVGGVRYAYPWVAWSVTLVQHNGELLREEDTRGELSAQYREEKDVVVSDRGTGVELHRGTTDNAEGIRVLIPDAARVVLHIDGVRYR